jgi:hypothetical protein
VLDSVLQPVPSVESLKKVFASRARVNTLMMSSCTLSQMFYLLKQAFGFKLYYKLYYMKLMCIKFTRTSYLWFCMLYVLCLCILGSTRIP